jgi:hypothetical protein
VTLKWEQQTPLVEKLGGKLTSVREYPAVDFELRRSQA